MSQVLSFSWKGIWIFFSWFSVPCAPSACPQKIQDWNLGNWPDSCFFDGIVPWYGPQSPLPWASYTLNGVTGTPHVFLMASPHNTSESIYWLNTVQKQGSGQFPDFKSQIFQVFKDHFTNLFSDFGKWPKGCCEIYQHIYKCGIMCVFEGSHKYWTWWSRHNTGQCNTSWRTFKMSSQSARP